MAPFTQEIAGSSPAGGIGLTTVVGKHYPALRSRPPSAVKVRRSQALPTDSPAVDVVPRGQGDCPASGEVSDQRGASRQGTVRATAR